MSSFVWIRDIYNKQHYVNVDHIIRVSKYEIDAYVFLNGNHTTTSLVVDIKKIDDVIENIRRVELTR